MNTIWKFPIQVTDFQYIEMPEWATILYAGLDTNSIPCIWALVNTLTSTEHRKIYVFGTNNPIIDSDIIYIGSFNQGQFVWHVFE